ncbi:MAG: ATPase domain-containing protein, partial [Candidatus Saccharicenans sp.]
PGLFLGFEESATSLRQNALGFGWDLEALEKGKKFFILEGQLNPETIVSGKFSLKPILSIISHKAKEMGAKRLVIDALDVLLQLLDEPFAIRTELHYLNHWLSQQGLTTILTLKPRDGQFRLQDFFYSMADCVVQLDSRVLNQITTRRLRVIKYRGAVLVGTSILLSFQVLESRPFPSPQLNSSTSHLAPDSPPGSPDWTVYLMVGFTGPPAL